MSYPKSNWQVIAQLALVENNSGLMRVSTFYVTYQDPIRYQSVQWTHTPEPEKKPTGKTYGYVRGYTQMREAYDKLINRLNNPWTEIKAIESEEKIQKIIKKCIERVNESNNYLGN